MNDNIISINIPNAVSITVMAIIGALIWAGIRKWWGSGKGLPFATTISQATNAPAFVGG